MARDPDNRKVITKIVLTEISLVGRPSNPEARFDVWKAAGADPLAGADTALKAGADALARVGRTAVSEQADTIMKAFAARDTEIVRLTKVIAAKDAELTDLQKRFDHWLNAPAPAKCAGAHA